MSIVYIPSISGSSSSGITALTGDVTATGTGSVAATVANDAITYAKMQNVSANDKLLGRSTAGSGDVEEITCTAAGRALIGAASAAAQLVTIGALGVSNLGFSLVNGSLVASVGSSALTIAVKDNAGADPSASSPVTVLFRNATAATGDYVVITITAATSFVVSSGSTLGTTNSTAFRIWVVGFNDAGTFRLGVVNCRSGSNVMALSDVDLMSSTAEGGAGAADSAQVVYTGTAVTTKAMRILGYLEYSSGLATAGTWSSTPTKLQLFSAATPMPGARLQTSWAELTTVATGTTVIPLDDTIPQSTEGDQYLTCAITPKSAANLLEYDVSLPITADGNVASTAALFRDSETSAIAASSVWFIAAQGGYIAAPVRMHARILAASTSAQTFKVRAGGNTGTLTVNGSAGARYYGGTVRTFIYLTEIMS